MGGEIISEIGNSGKSSLVEQPNHFVLEGKDVKVVYDSDGFDGNPHLSYEVSGENHDLSAGIERLDTYFGQFVMSAVDRHGTTFALLIPSFNGSEAASFETLVIVSKNNLAQTSEGAKQTYTVIHLSGKAEKVYF